MAQPPQSLGGNMGDVPFPVTPASSENQHADGTAFTPEPVSDEKGPHDEQIPVKSEADECLDRLAIPDQCRPNTIVAAEEAILQAYREAGPLLTAQRLRRLAHHTNELLLGKIRKASQLENERIRQEIVLLLHKVSMYQSLAIQAEDTQLLQMARRHQQQ